MRSRDEFRATGRRSAWLVAPAVAIAVLVVGCGGTKHQTASSTHASTSPTAPAGTAVPPVSDLALVSGTSEHQIRATVTAFYRAAWQDDAQRACSLFSAQGATGFIDAAKQAFPASVNQFSTCTKVMEIYNAALKDSVSNLQQSDPTLTGDRLNNVTIGDLVIHGNTASATGPLNALPMINPRTLYLVRQSGRWLMNGEKTPKSDLQKLATKGQPKSKK